MRQYYQVQNHETGARHGDGSPVILRDCGHQHRTYDAAACCQHRLLAYNPRTQLWVAAWHNSQVYRVDAAGGIHYTDGFEG